jgi:hypothetical protein
VTLFPYTTLFRSITVRMSLGAVTWDKATAVQIVLMTP